MCHRPACSDGLGMVGQGQTERSLVVTPRLNDRTMEPSRALDRDRGSTPERLYVVYNLKTKQKVISTQTVLDLGVIV